MCGLVSLNPKPQAPSPKPQTPNPKPQTLNPKRRINLKPNFEIEEAQVVHRNSRLSLLQALVTSSGYGVDLRGWLEGEFVMPLRVGAFGFELKACDQP